MVKFFVYQFFIRFIYGNALNNILLIAISIISIKNCTNIWLNLLMCVFVLPINPMKINTKTKLGIWCSRGSRMQKPIWWDQKRQKTSLCNLLYWRRENDQSGKCGWPRRFLWLIFQWFDQGITIFWLCAIVKNTYFSRY